MEKLQFLLTLRAHFSLHFCPHDVSSQKEMDKTTILVNQVQSSTGLSSAGEPVHQSIVEFVDVRAGNEKPVNKSHGMFTTETSQIYLPFKGGGPMRAESSKNLLNNLILLVLGLSLYFSRTI